MRIVIVGNGIAGVEAALTLRDRHPEWQITIVSEESDHLFSRTALMWVHSGQLNHRDIEPFERDLYERMNFKRIRARATGLDTQRKTVQLAGDLQPVPYDRLLIAAGSKPRPAPWPGSDATGIGHFVTMQDLEWLEKEVHGEPTSAGRPPRPDAHLPHSDDSSPYRPRPVAAEKRGRRPAHPCVVGGGLIGIEAVEVCVAASLHPRFVIREEWFWPIALSRRESSWICDRMGEHGVQVCLEYNVKGFQGDPVETMVTDHGDYPCDLAVVAIGVVPNTDWIDAGCGIRLDDRGGIITEPDLRTSMVDVYAAGDCASVRWFDGSQRPEQLWYTARDQGRVAARAMLDDDVQYDRGPWYNSAKLMDIEYTTAGLVNMRVEGEQNHLFEESGKVRSTNRIVSVDGKVIGFNFLGRRWDHEILLRWIDEKRRAEWVVDHLQDAAFDTEFTPPMICPPWSGWQVQP